VSVSTDIPVFLIATDFRSEADMRGRRRQWTSLPGSERDLDVQFHVLLQTGTKKDMVIITMAV